MTHRGPFQPLLFCDSVKYISEVWVRYGKEKWASHAALEIYSVGAPKWLLRVPLQSVEKNWNF